MESAMKEILARLQRGLPETLQLLERMVQMDSPSLDKPLVDGFVRFVGSQLEAIGGRVEYVTAERFGDHLVARFGSGTSKPILLLGHTDTVFPAGEAARRPFKLASGQATGPGVFDMKGGIAVMWSALRALGDIQRNVTVVLNSDEEMGSVSSRELIHKEASAAVAVLVLEPSLPGGVLKTARKGTGRFTVKAIGRAAHAGVDPERGINAIEEIAQQVLQLQRLSDADRGTTITVSVIQGGTRVNVVPAEAAIEVDVRASTMEEADRVSHILRALKPHLPGARIEVRGGFNRPPMERTAYTERLFSAAKTIGSKIGLDVQEGSTGGASDGNLTAALGIPTLDGLGPVGDNAHSPEEFIDTESLPGRAALVAGLILSL
jgi:glutamate carboxypeptidase